MIGLWHFVPKETYTRDPYLEQIRLAVLYGNPLSPSGPSSVTFLAGSSEAANLKNAGSLGGFEFSFLETAVMALSVRPAVKPDRYIKPASTTLAITPARVAINAPARV